MRPRERRDTGQSDLLRSRLDAIIDVKSRSTMTPRLAGCNVLGSLHNG
jgi:hypothetical protein